MLVLAFQSVSATTVKFGAKVAAGYDPSNAYPGIWCDHEIDGGSDTYGCTWILNQALNGGTVSAPQSGHINKVKHHQRRWRLVQVRRRAQERIGSVQGPALERQGLLLDRPVRPGLHRSRLLDLVAARLDR